MLRLGIILQNRYRTIQILGQGGMGAVYLAEDQRLKGRMVAIKENLPPPTLTDEALRQLHLQFQSEARILARLDHPNLPKVSDFFSEGGGEYLVMDYVEGETLQQSLSKQSSPYQEQVVLGWTLQLCDVLSYLHSQTPPIIFRDLKPSNIILTSRGQLKLIDFGIARFFRQGQKQDTISIGTPSYSPLEQYGGSQTDPRSDIYSLGATLYYLLSNVEPIQAAQRVLMPASLLPPRQLNPYLSPQIEAVMLKAMAIEPHERYQTVQEMKHALLGAEGLAPSERTTLILSPPAALSASRLPPLQRLLPFILFFLVTLLVGIAVGGWYFSSSPPPAPPITIELVAKGGVNLTPVLPIDSATVPAPTQSATSSPTVPINTATRRPTVTATATLTRPPQPILFFDEQFDGTALDSTAWNYANEAGQMSLENGILKLAAFGPQYPYLHSQENPFPARGNFQMVTRFRYPEVKDCGVGILMASAVVPSGLDPTKTGEFQQKEEKNGVTIGVWQDMAQSLQLWVRAGEERLDKAFPGPDTDWHEMRIDYIEAQYTLYLDNKLIYTSNETDYRPSVIWMGHPANLETDCWWDTFEVDWIQSWQLRNGLGPHPGPLPTLGEGGSEPSPRPSPKVGS